MSTAAGMTQQDEKRWPVAAAILVLLGIVAALPDHYRLLPYWMPFVIATAACLPVAGVVLSTNKHRWFQLEAILLKIVAVYAILSAAVTVSILIRDIVVGSAQASGFELMTSSVAVWCYNVLGFSILYWQTDGGGPKGRIAEKFDQPDWLFAQMTVPSKVPSDWRPTFVDYFFLAFSTATAFSTTDTVPLTARAKLLMMLEALVSMVTLVVIASRAINVLAT